MNSKNFVVLFITLGLVALSGCSTRMMPSKIDRNSFKLLEDSHIQPQNSFPFSVCLFEGFDGWRGFSRQTRLIGKYRVDTIANGGNRNEIILSADVFDNGHTNLLVSDDMVMINTAEPQSIFKSCLATYSK